MERLINKYLGKLERQGLARREDAIFMALDAEMFSSAPARGDLTGLEGVFDLMNINSLLFARAAEPYRSIIDELICRREIFRVTDGRIIPEDCETRTFFHDIPIVADLQAKKVAEALSRRKSAVLKGGYIVTYGVVTPEQAFVSFSSACFSLFVKYFRDGLSYLRSCEKTGVRPDASFLGVFEEILRLADYLPEKPALLLKTDARSADLIVEMLSEAGRAMVSHRLVDSYFGNISYVQGGVIYISQTGSSLDELDDSVDAVPLDGSSSAGITASSELSAHKNIYLATGDNAILHGHPRFSVIMSMDCLNEFCQKRGVCHRYCAEERLVEGVPVVPGEIGTGPTGLASTVPGAMKRGKAIHGAGCAMVYGHGVFASGRGDFRQAFRAMFEVERSCRDRYTELACALVRRLSG